MTGLSTTALLRLEADCGSLEQMRRARSSHWLSGALCVKNTVGRPMVDEPAALFEPVLPCSTKAGGIVEHDWKRLLLHDPPYL